MNNTPHIESCDLLIVGAGGAGLSAAIHAREKGLRVVVLEKAPSVGGTTAWSVGSFSASQTRHQKKLNIEDRADLHFEDMDRFNAGKGEVDNLLLRRLFVDHASSTLEWLESLGIVFDGPYPESHHRHPRMHNVIPNSNSFTHHLLKRCKEIGVEIHTHCKVTSLIQENGKVTGLKTWQQQTPKEWHAMDGVLLCAGDFAADTDMKTQFLGPLIAKAASVNPMATGDGIKLGLSAGGKVLNGSHASALKIRFIPAGKNWLQGLPPLPWLAKSIVWALQHLPDFMIRPFVMKFITTVLGPEPSVFDSGAILIDDQAQRVNVQGTSPAQSIVQTPHNKAYIVFNAQTAKQLNAWPNFISTAPGLAYAYLHDYEHARSDICKKAPTLKALADKLGLDAEQFSRASHDLEPSHCYYAMGPVKSYVTITEGGLAIDQNFQVLDQNDQPIQGLYAAGSNGQGGLLLEGHGHHIGWAFVSGRMAGLSIAKFSQRNIPK